MTLEDKLRLTFNSKEDTRLAINEKGVEVLKSDTFASYPQAIDSIGNEGDIETPEEEKITFKNIIKNGNFSTGLDNWNIDGIFSWKEAEDGLEIYDMSANTFVSLSQNSNGLIDDDIYYGTTQIKLQNKTNRPNYVSFEMMQGESEDISVDGSIESNIVHRFSVLGSPEKRYNREFKLLFIIDDRLNSFIINRNMMFNLTDSFGSGNEPTKEEMDMVMDKIDYIDGVEEVSKSEFQQAYSTMSERTREIADVLLGVSE